MIICSSSGFSDDKLFAFCAEKLNFPKEKIKACIVTTASIPLKSKDKWVTFTKDYLMDKNVSEVSFFDFETDDVKELLEYNLIIITGGNPYNLFHYVKQTKAENDLIELSKSNKIIVGISAGALLFTNGIQYIGEWNSIMGFDMKDNEIGLKDLEGLRITNMFLFPHYDLFLQRKSNLEMELGRIEDRDKIKIYRLNNNQSFYLNEEIPCEI